MYPEKGWEQGRKAAREEGTRTGTFEHLPDGTSTACFICLMKKVDLSFKSFRQGFFSLSWKCLPLSGGFLTVTYEIKIFISYSRIARTPVSSVETEGQRWLDELAACAGWCEKYFSEPCHSDRDKGPDPALGEDCSLNEGLQFGKSRGSRGIRMGRYFWNGHCGNSS